MSEIKAWKILQSDYVVENEKYRLRKDICQVPDGTIIQDYFVREEPDAVIMCCVTKDNHVVLVRQYRHGLGATTLEFPGGYISRHDINAVEAMRRELMEETGFSVDRVEPLGTFILAPSSAAAKVTVYLGTDGERITAPQYIPDEHTEVELVTLAALPELVKNPDFVSMVHVAALSLALTALADQRKQ